MLERALAMSIEESAPPSTSTSAAPQEPDFSAMTEDEQIAFALRMSMQDVVATRKCIAILITNSTRISNQR